MRLILIDGGRRDDKRETVESLVACTARDYEADFAADGSLPAEHRRLRRVLFAIAAARRRRKSAR
jgi:hypothetical protein